MLRIACEDGGTIVVTYLDGSPVGFEGLGSALRVVGLQKVVAEDLKSPSKIVARELPPKRPGHLLVVALEIQEPLLDGVKIGKVIRGQNFPLNDGKVYLNLVEPTGMNGQVNSHRVGPFCGEPLNKCGSTVRRTVVYNPEDPSSRPVRRLSHDLIDQTVKRSYTTVALTVPEDSGAMDVPGRQIDARPTPFIFMLDLHELSRFRRAGWMLTDSGLNACLFVGGKDVIVGSQGLFFPLVGIQVQDTACFLQEAGISGKNPTPMKPGPNGVFVQPAPNTGVTHRGDYGR